MLLLWKPPETAIILPVLLRDTVPVGATNGSELEVVGKFVPNLAEFGNWLLDEKQPDPAELVDAPPPPPASFVPDIEVKLFCRLVLL